MGRSGERMGGVSSGDWVPGEHVGLSLRRRSGGWEGMDGILFAMREGAASYRVSAASHGGARNCWVSLGVIEEREGRR